MTHVDTITAAPDGREWFLRAYLAVIRDGVVDVYYHVDGATIDFGEAEYYQDRLYLTTWVDLLRRSR
jgi:hypothetical protein